MFLPSCPTFCSSSPLLRRVNSNPSRPQRPQGRLASDLDPASKRDENDGQRLERSSNRRRHHHPGGPSSRFSLLYSSNNSNVSRRPRSDRRATTRSAGECALKFPVLRRRRRSKPPIRSPRNFRFRFLSPPPRGRENRGPHRGALDQQRPLLVPSRPSTTDSPNMSAPRRSIIRTWRKGAVLGWTNRGSRSAYRR